MSWCFFVVFKTALEWYMLKFGWGTTFASPGLNSGPGLCCFDAVHVYCIVPKFRPMFFLQRMRVVILILMEVFQFGTIVASRLLHHDLKDWTVYPIVIGFNSLINAFQPSCSRLLTYKIFVLYLFSVETRNLPSLICLYWSYLLSRGSLGDLHVKTKSNSSNRRSSIKD